MTNEQIFELMKKHFRLCPVHDIAYIEWIAETEDVLRFSKAIRKETIEEILTLLKDVPNPEANRTAINRIEWAL